MKTTFLTLICIAISDLALSVSFANLVMPLYLPVDLDWSTSILPAGLAIRVTIPYKRNLFREPCKSFWQSLITVMENTKSWSISRGQGCPFRISVSDIHPPRHTHRMASGVEVHFVCTSLLYRPEDALISLDVFRYSPWLATKRRRTGSPEPADGLRRADSIMIATWLEPWKDWSSVSMAGTKQIFWHIIVGALVVHYNIQSWHRRGEKKKSCLTVCYSKYMFAAEISLYAIRQVSPSVRKYKFKANCVHRKRLPPFLSPSKDLSLTIRALVHSMSMQCTLPCMRRKKLWYP